jgi:hypothetical protein
MWLLISKTNLRKAWKRVLEGVDLAGEAPNRRDRHKRRERRRGKKRQKNC